MAKDDGSPAGSMASTLAPLTGLAFLVVVIVGFAVSGSPPSASDDSAAEIVAFYKENSGRQFAGALAEGIAGTLFVFFGATLRRALRAAEGGRSILSTVAFAGSVIFALGLALDATIVITITEAVDHIDPVGVQALTALYNNDFIPFAMGVQCFMLATGLSVVRYGALPKWIGWTAIVIGIIAMSPIGFAAFIATGVLVGIISVLLTLRARAVSPADDHAAVIDA